MDDGSHRPAQLVLGIDLGTSYFKAGLFDRQGHLRGLGRVQVQTDSPGSGQYDLPVERFWTSIRSAVTLALREAGATAQHIAGLSYSSQANSFVLLDENAAPLTPLIIWSDLRAQEVDDALAALWRRDDYLETTGTDLASPQLAVAKLRWFQRNEPKVWARTHRIQTISDYFAYTLTDQFVGDEGTTALLGLWNMRERAWWPAGLEAAGIHREQLGGPLPPGTRAGEVTPEGAKRLGIRPGIPFAVGSLDHHTAAIGAGLGILAPATESTGTVLCALRGTDTYVARSGCCIGPGTHGVGGNHRHYTFAFDGNGAGTLEWYQRTQAPGMSIEELLEHAQKVPAGADGLVIRPLSAGTPSLEAFAGRKSQHGHGHYARAILESTATSLAGLMDQLYSDELPEAVCATGGGARSDLWLQIKANTLGKPFIRTRCPEPACLGAGLFAAVACGWFPSLAEASEAMVATSKTFYPNV